MTDRTHTVFAIQHVPTGEFMPARMFRSSSRGWSLWKSGPEFDKPHDANPRIFFTLPSAVRAQAAWYAGVWARTEVPGGMFDPPEEGSPMPVPTCGRDKGTLRIVPLYLTGPL